MQPATRNLQPATRNLQPATCTIGVFDSGIGGLSVANAISGQLPRESILYVADNARAPYGPQPAESILAYSHEITRWLIATGAKMIVVACNTATSIAIDSLRERFPEIPFVGLEPAVKPAAAGRCVGVLATAATLNSPRYLALKERYLADRPIYEDPCLGLVPLIEQESSGSQVLAAKLHTILDPMLEDGLDTLVLGCTHYPMIREDIQAVCGPGVTIIDPAPAAARQVRRLLKEHGLEVETSPSLLSANLPCPRVRAHDFFATGSSQPLQRALLCLPSLNDHRRLLVPHHPL